MYIERDAFYFKNLELSISFFFVLKSWRYILSMVYLQVKRDRKEQMKTCYREEEKETLTEKELRK